MKLDTTIDEVINKLNKIILNLSFRLIVNIITKIKKTQRAALLDFVRKIIDIVVNNKTQFIIDFLFCNLNIQSGKYKRDNTPPSVFAL
jgi:hypothetical protein